MSVVGGGLVGFDVCIGGVRVLGVSCVLRSLHWRVKAYTRLCAQPVLRSLWTAKVREAGGDSRVLLVFSLCVMVVGCWCHQGVCGVVDQQTITWCPLNMRFEGV